MERLQLVYLHDPEHESFEHMMAPGGPVEVLLDLKSEGVIEHLGVAGGPIDLEIRFVETGLFEAVITHNRYTLVDRSAEPLLDVAAERGVAALNAAPYGSGILAKGPDAYARYAYQKASKEMVERVRAMQEACREFDVPLAAAALSSRCGPPRRLDHRRHDPPGAGRADAGTRDLPDPRRALGEVGCAGFPGRLTRPARPRVSQPLSRDLFACVLPRAESGHQVSERNFLPTSP
jgi:hypothetical protein